MNLRWFISKTVRQAVAVHKHVHRILCAQRDILTVPAIQGVQTELNELQGGIRGGATEEFLKNQMVKVEDAANKWLKPYPNPAWRENIEVLLVALAIAMGIRTFFLQPFKIPTGSMQPTLYGVTADNLLKKPNVQIPTGWERAREWFEGISYIDIKTKSGGRLQSVSEPVGVKIFNLYQSVRIGNEKHMIYMPPDYGQQSLASRAGFVPGDTYEFRPGEQVIRLKVQAGDHLFVDRLSYNFRTPQRGEIVVFQTAGIQHPNMPQDQFYIKRLVALGGERVQIGDDRHLIINGERLDASTPHFENVYSFNPKDAPHDHNLPNETRYSGHVNDTVAHQYSPYSLAPLFPDQTTIHTNDPKGLMVMGDNTMNSFDSRGWGEFPADNVIGKSFFVYWPITKRFGWGNR